jgi:hypothetical protein
LGAAVSLLSVVVLVGAVVLRRRREAAVADAPVTVPADRVTPPPPVAPAHL